MSHPVGAGLASRHRYFIWQSPAEGDPIELPSGVGWDPRLMPELKYPLAVLAEAELDLRIPDLHFYITKNPVELPEYGDHVVALLWQDERCKYPAYARHVRGVIRCSQLFPFLGFRSIFPLSRYKAVLTFQYLRDWFTHLRSVRALRRATPARSPLHIRPRIFTIPLGYHSQEVLPQVPMAARQLDAFFTGEVHSPVPKSSYRYWTSTSKTQARKQLWRVLSELKRDPQWRIEMGNIAGGEGTPRTPEFYSYSAKMMNSRICVAPRGTIAETYRFYEGLRAGCMVISNQQPPEPFLQGAPCIQIDDWRELPKLMRRYARDLDALEHYRRASLLFWQTRLSEAVIGRQVARFVDGDDAPGIRG